MKPGKTNISDFFSWGNLERAVVDVNLSLICNRHLDNFPKHFNGFPLRVFLFEEDPISIGWNNFPKSFQTSHLGRLRKLNPLTAGYNGLTTAGLVEYLNFTPKYISPDPPDDRYAFKTEQGIIMGSGKVVYSKFDFVGMLHFVTGRQGMDYDFLQPVYFDKYCIISPKARRIPLFLASKNCFKPDVWFFILTIPWSSTFVLKTLNYLKPYKEPSLRPSTAYRLVCLFFYVLISISANIKTKAQTERWILSGCMAFSIIFVTIFGANLTSHITRDVRFEEINTLRELADSNLKIITNSPFMIKIVFGDVENSTDPVIIKLKSNLVMGNDSIYNSVMRRGCVIRQMLDFRILNVSI